MILPRLVAGGLALLGWVQIFTLPNAVAQEPSTGTGKPVANAPADTAKPQPETAKASAETAKASAETAITTTETAKTTANPLAETAKMPADTGKAEAKTLAETAKAAAREPIERRPYRISFHLQCDPSARGSTLAAAPPCCGSGRCSLASGSSDLRGW